MTALISPTISNLTNSENASYPVCPILIGYICVNLLLIYLVKE